eukprot:3378557-Prymnesium_polylepis.1
MLRTCRLSRAQGVRYATVIKHLRSAAFTSVPTDRDKVIRLFEEYTLRIGDALTCARRAAILSEARSKDASVIPRLSSSGIRRCSDLGFRRSSGHRRSSNLGVHRSSGDARRSSRESDRRASSFVGTLTATTARMRR